MMISNIDTSEHRHLPGLDLERECCVVPDVASPAGTPVVALVGAPNSGKSTLFNLSLIHI